MNRKLTDDKAVLLRHLLRRPRTYSDLQFESGLSAWVVQTFVRGLKANGEVYIADWFPGRQGRMIVPMFKLGTGRDDAERPALTAAQRMANSRARRKLQQI